MHTVNRIAILCLLAGLGACSLQPDPPPDIPKYAYSGTGDLMAKCMQYASESYCEQDIWGGDEP